MTSAGELRQTVNDLIEGEEGLPIEAAVEQIRELTEENIVAALRAVITVSNTERGATRETYDTVTEVEVGLATQVRPYMDRLTIGAGAFPVLGTNRAVKAQEEAVDSAAGKLTGRELQFLRYSAVMQSLIEDIETITQPQRAATVDTIEMVRAQQKVAKENAESYKDAL